MGRHSIGPRALCRAYLLINILLPLIQINEGLLSTYAEKVDNFSPDPINEIDNSFDETRSTITIVPPSDGNSPPPEIAHALSKKGLPGPLYHNVSGYAIENVEICKSGPFALSQENYLLSGADEWLRDFTIKNQHRKYMKKHGLISTIAYDFLGYTNFKCAIGYQHLCIVQCTAVVERVKDLREARQIYFVLASSSHFISALTVVHEALVAAQSTSGLLAGKMAITFFYTQPSPDEEMRARAYQLLMEGTLWAAQTALSAILPMLPWSQLARFTTEIVDDLQKKNKKPLLDKGKGRAEGPSSLYAPFDVSRYYGFGGSSGLYADVNAQRISQIFKDDNMREFFQEEGIHPEDILHYVEDSRPVTGPHVWQVVQHLAELSHDRMPSEYRDDNSEPEAEPEAEPKKKKGKKGRLPLPHDRSETMEEYREWERKKKNQLFDEIMAVEPLKIGVPDRYRFERAHPRFDELRARLQGDDTGAHSRTFGPGDEVIGREAANLEVARHSRPGGPSSNIWSDTVRVAWGYFKGLGANSWRKAGGFLDWIDSDMTPPYKKIGLVNSDGFDDYQVAHIKAGIKNKITNVDPDRLVNPNVPDAPNIPIRRLSYEEYLSQRDAQNAEDRTEKGKKEKKGKKKQKDKSNQEEQVDQDPEPRLTSLGPVDKVPYYRDRGTPFNDFKMDLTALLHPVLEGDFKSEKARKRSLSWHEKIAKTEKVLYGFFPVWQAGVVDNTVGLMFSKWQANDPSKDQNQMNLHYVIQQSSVYAREELKKVANRIFGPLGFRSNGDSEIADLMAAGSLLPVSEGSLEMWASADVEKFITKTVIHRAINAAFKSQKIYISCTQDLLRFEKKGSKGIKVEECRLDNSGPENLKACIGEVACYLYRWNDRSLIMGHHNEKPFGLKELAGPPWDIEIKDIITSSFFSKINKKENAQLGDNSANFINFGPGGNTALNASTAGVFTIPVCLAPKNWNTQIDDYWMVNDIEPHASIKALPCYCGDLGQDTSQIWQDTGLMSSKAQHTYTHTNCPNQFEKRLPDWLEHYVAMCNMNIRKAKVGNKIKSGKHALCDLVTHELRRAGVQTVTELKKQVRDALKCKIKRKKNGECKKYYRTPISSVWDETKDTILEDEEKKLNPQQKDTPIMPVVDGFTSEELRDWEWALAEIDGMRGEFKEMDRVQSERHIDMRTLPVDVPASALESRWGGSHDDDGKEEDEDQDEDEDEDMYKGFGDKEIGRGENEDLGGEPGTWGEDGLFRYDGKHFV